MSVCPVCDIEVFAITEVSALGFGVGIEYTIGGRKVSEREFHKHMFEDEPLRIVREHMEGVATRVRAIVCPVHGESPTAEVVRTSKGYNVESSSCCEAAAELVRTAASS